VATFHVGLKRSGPGLLLRDILTGTDAQVLAVRNTIAAANPDILLLTRFDFDLDKRALIAFADLLAQAGADYPYRFALAPNTGVSTGFDIDRDGYRGDARDAQGYGDFAGQGGMALLSRFPIQTEGARDFSQFLWRDLPDAQLPIWPAGQSDAFADQRLSSVAHWDVPITLPSGLTLNILAYHATTPAFDGPEDRNGLRNQDETLFWLRYLEGSLSTRPPSAPFVILGDANLDPVDGDGRKQAIRTLLNSPWLQDPEPRSARAAAASKSQGGVNTAQRGDPALDTADWPDAKGPGNLRVDYVLPSRGLAVLDAGVAWPVTIDAPVPKDGTPSRGADQPGTGWFGWISADNPMVITVFRSVA